MGKGKEFLVGAVNVGFYVINLKFIPVLAAPSRVCRSRRRKYPFSGIARRFGWDGLSQSVPDLTLDLIHSKSAFRVSSDNLGEGREKS